MDALVVSADPKELVRLIDLGAGDGQLANPQQSVGGWIDVVAHRECDLVINDEGRINDSPVNVRVTHWVLNESTLARQGRAGEWSVIYGDVVVTGPADRYGDTTAVDRAMVEYFEGLQLEPNAVADWDVRDVRWVVTDWPEMDRGDDGLGL